MAVRAHLPTCYVMSPLPPSFYDRPTLAVARDLIGALLVYDSPDDGRLVGRVVETEGYRADDPAMHGWRATFGGDGFVRPIGRAADLFAAPGTAYVYRIHHTNWLLNVVTEPEGVAGGVLLAIIEGVAALVDRYRGVADTLRRADESVSRAIAAIAAFPDSSAKQALVSAAAFSVSRDR